MLKSFVGVMFALSLGVLPNSRWATAASPP